MASILVTILMIAGTASAEPADPNVGLPRFVGRYRFVGGEEEVRALDVAIDNVVRKMNFLIRGIARRRIRAPNQPSPEIEMALEGRQIRISRPGRPTIAAPADGTPIEWRNADGDSFQVSHGFSAGTLYQRFHDGRSDSDIRYRLSEDGKHLTIDITIVARRLPAPLSFRTTYERIADPPAR